MSVEHLALLCQWTTSPFTNCVSGTPRPSRTVSVEHLTSQGLCQGNTSPLMDCVTGTSRPSLTDCINGTPRPSRTVSVEHLASQGLCQGNTSPLMDCVTGTSRPSRTTVETPRPSRTVQWNTSPFMDCVSVNTSPLMDCVSGTPRPLQWKHLDPTDCVNGTHCPSLTVPVEHLVPNFKHRHNWLRHRSPLSSISIQTILVLLVPA